MRGRTGRAIHRRLDALAHPKRRRWHLLFTRTSSSFLAAKRAHPELPQRASSVLDDIEREAEARREAIAVLFGSEQPTGATAPTSRARRGRSPGEPLND